MLINCKETELLSNEKKEKLLTAKVGKAALRVGDETIKITKARLLAPRKYAFRAANGKSNVLKIVDTKIGKWVVRVDKGHAKGATTPHININKAITKMPDPHIPISAGALKTCEVVNKISNKMNAANKFLLPIAIALDSIRIGRAIYKDFFSKKNKKKFKKQPKETIKTVSSVAAGWSGGFAGGYAGSQAGAAIGGAIGAGFGGVGAIPGAAIGGIAGSIIGAISLGIGASIAAEEIAEKVNNIIFVDDDKESKNGNKLITEKSEKEKNPEKKTTLILYVCAASQTTTTPENFNFFLIDTENFEEEIQLQELSDFDILFKNTLEILKNQIKSIAFNVNDFKSSPKYQNKEELCEHLKKLCENLKINNYHFINNKTAALNTHGKDDVVAAAANTFSKSDSSPAVLVRREKRSMKNLGKILLKNKYNEFKFFCKKKFSRFLK